MDIGVDTGELASPTIVPTTAGKHAAHAVEQFSLRKNVNPKIHVTDNWPCNEDLFYAIFGINIILRLGIFHFIQRFTNTLRKEHEDFGRSCSEFSDCIFFEDPGDVRNVEVELKYGRLGGKGPLNPIQIAAVKADRKQWSNYRCYIRKRTYDLDALLDNMDVWYEKHYEKYIPNTAHATLFLRSTKHQFDENQGKAYGILDVLGIDVLFEPIAASYRAVCKLPKWFNNRGVESKLEKAHHALAHFGNGGMGNDLCDTLNLEGTATYNRNICFRRLLSLMTAEEIKAISPATYQEYHPHTDHCRLAFLNQLGREVGLFIDVHFDVEILPPDNGERFFSEYLKQQLLRMKTFPPDPVTGRCMCNRCGGRKHINNKYSNTTSINRIVVRNEEKQAEQQRNDNTTAVARLSTATTATTTTTITSDTDTDTASMPIATSTSTTIAALSTFVADSAATVTAAGSKPVGPLPAAA